MMSGHAVHHGKKLVHEIGHGGRSRTIDLDHIKPFNTGEFHGITATCPRGSLIIAIDVDTHEGPDCAS